MVAPLSDVPDSPFVTFPFTAYRRKLKGQRSLASEKTASNFNPTGQELDEKKEDFMKGILRPVQALNYLIFEYKKKKEKNEQKNNLLLTDNQGYWKLIQR
jgi:hypothetical protein